VRTVAGTTIPRTASWRCGVYEIPATQWSRAGDTYTFKGIPVYDAPILIADRSLIRIAQ
jgi:hypothetical protein